MCNACAIENVKQSIASRRSLFSGAAAAGLVGIGVDTLSLDSGNSADLAMHFSWLPGGRYGIENMANLDQLPARGTALFVGAPKHKGGTGGPARIMAVM